MVRTLRKHRTALIAIAVYNFVLFFPVAFMGRALSPNDVFYNYEPWASLRPAEVVRAQNSLINDAPTSWYTIMSLVKDDWRAFHWNPYVASGIPGFGSSAAAVLSPLILLPLLVVPLKWIYTAIVFVKLNAAFVFAYLWLREERLGRRGAAIGAIVIAGAGIYSVRWLWQMTNATALYPALLWVTRRTFNGRPIPMPFVAVLALAYALAGFPAGMAYGAWMVAVYAVVLAIRCRGRGVARHVGRTAIAVGIGVLIALPSLVPLVQLLLRSGYLDARAGVSLAGTYPASQWMSFINPERLGNPVYKNWVGDPALGPSNNYVDAMLYLGIFTVLLVLLGLANRRARMRWFWAATAVFVLACIFGAPVLSAAVADVPGVKYSVLARLAVLLPLAAGYLAAAARLRRSFVYGAFSVLVAFDLALVAGRFHPYLDARNADVPPTTMTQFLRAEKGPYRVAPFFGYLWPNTAELVRVEDVRSHFGSEEAYRRMLMRIDPTAWGGGSTILTFNSLQYDLRDPLNALLGIRWFIEQKSIDIIRWGTFEATVPGVEETGAIELRPGTVLQRTVRVDAEPFWAIEVPLRVEEERGRDARVEISLLKNGRPVWSRAFRKSEVDVLQKVYVPLRPYARLGESVTLRVRSIGVRGSALEGENEVAGEAPLFYGRVTTPVVFDRELPEGRLFRNLAELPRFRAVSRLRKLNDDEFLAVTDIDFADEAVITDDPVMPPELGPADARVTLTHYAPDQQRITTESSAPFFLASSEKLTPELRVTIDGRDVRPIEVDMIFAGVTVPAGRHEVVYSRRIARGGWWWASAAGVVLWLATVVVYVRERRRARSS